MYTSLNKLNICPLHFLHRLVKNPLSLFLQSSPSSATAQPTQTCQMVFHCDAVYYPQSSLAVDSMDAPLTPDCGLSGVYKSSLMGQLLDGLPLSLRKAIETEAPCSTTAIGGSREKSTCEAEVVSIPS